MRQEARLGEVRFACGCARTLIVAGVVFLPEEMLEYWRTHYAGKLCPRCEARAEQLIEPEGR